MFEEGYTNECAEHEEGYSRPEECTEKRTAYKRGPQGPQGPQGEPGAFRR